jgi:hypothetical protein
MEFVGRSSPKVTNLLRLDITRGERRTLQWRCRNLQNRQRRSVGSQRLGHSWDGWNKRRQWKALPGSDQRCNRSEGILHLGEKIWERLRWIVEHICGNIPRLIYPRTSPYLPQMNCHLVSFPWSFPPTAMKSTQDRTTYELSLRFQILEGDVDLRNGEIVTGRRHEKSGGSRLGDSIARQVPVYWCSVKSSWVMVMKCRYWT